MPHRDRLEIICAIREQHPGTKIIALSEPAAIGDTDVLDLALRLGADAALRKPVSANDLRNCVVGCLGEGGGSGHAQNE